MPTRWLLIALLLLSASRLSAQPDAPGAEAPGKLTFHDSLEPTLRTAQEKRRVTAVFFSATWCGWCRKLEANTLIDVDVRKAGAAFEWVKIDIDRHPDLAERYEIAGVPDVVLLDIHGRVINRTSGYMAPAAFAAFLNNAADKIEGVDPLADVRSVIEDMRRQLSGAKSPQEAHTAMEPALVMLARSDRLGREMLLDAMTSLDGNASGALLIAMNDDRLAVRAAAATALAHATHMELPFDPFGDADARRSQVDAWRAALAKKAEAAN